MAELMTEPINPLSKQAQRLRSPGNKYCPKTGELREVCEGRECVGWRAQRDGRKAQNRSRRQLQQVSGGKVVARSGSQATHEEWWRGAVRMETKSGREVNPIVTRFLNAETQALLAKNEGDIRPLIVAVQAEGMTDQIWMFRRSQLENILEALS